MIETGQVEAGPGAVVRTRSSKDCELRDYKVVITADKRVFVRGDLRGELVELVPASPEFRQAEHNDCLEMAQGTVIVIWMRVIQ